MATVGAREARKRFSALLDRVGAGEEITITRHGKPVARLVGIEHRDRAKAAEAVARPKRLRKGTTLGGLSWQALRDEGRR